MNTDKIYSVTFNLMQRCQNQSIEMTFADLVDELEKLNALPKETVWQMRLAILHREHDKL